MKIFFDCETTGKNPYICEPIEIFFLLESGDSYLFQSQVDNWSQSAELIHGITEAETLLYPHKRTAFNDLIEWLPKEFELVCFANPRTELGTMLYDEVVLKMNLMNHLELDNVNHLPFKITSYSVHTLARDCAKKGLFEPYRNPETNRQSFTQENVYRALFDEEYNSHRAESDVNAMKKIYDTLQELRESGISIASKSQLSLF